MSELVAVLEVEQPQQRHQWRAWATGLRDLPFYHAKQNQVWLEIALGLLAWMPRGGTRLPPAIGDDCL
ncbi:hypothetical protein [Actinomadura rugatobispora]|uniref:Uncharacterized protein n=1 Tax=Actinomadura rugatobispora TaxID=1994 RepID=A0ABW1ABM5_9ACTN|nr:hypothetical protein GCM10010200_017680 [Actinomadura rugatobispora]